jgi:hypothetical protein
MLKDLANPKASLTTALISTFVYRPMNKTSIAKHRTSSLTLDMIQTPVGFLKQFFYAESFMTPRHAPFHLQRRLEHQRNMIISSRNNRLSVPLHESHNPTTLTSTTVTLPLPN